MTNQVEQYHTFQEIMNHAVAWRSALKDVEAKAEGLRALWKPDEIDEVIFEGCGSTYYLSRTAADIFQGTLGEVGKAVPSSDVVLFPNIVLAGNARRMMFVISRSGETSETIKAIEVFREHGGELIVGITCYEESTLGKTASLALVAREGHEKSVAQTRSFSSMLVAVQAICKVLAGQTLDGRFGEIPELSVALLEMYSGLVKQIGEDSRLDRFFFLGSGPFYGLACEIMLKMKEMSLSYAEAFHFLEFRHGPMSMVDDKTLIVSLVSEQAHDYEASLMADMRSLGARVLAVTPVELTPDQADYQVILPEGLNDLERGALYLPVLQLLAFYRSVHKGLNPDQPRHLTAVISLDMNKANSQ